MGGVGQAFHGAKMQLHEILFYEPLILPVSLLVRPHGFIHAGKKTDAQFFCRFIQRASIVVPNFKNMLVRLDAQLLDGPTADCFILRNRCPAFQFSCKARWLAELVV